MYKYLSQHYDQLFQFNHKIEDFLKQFIAINKNAIDLGCGTGRLTHVISNLGMNVEGVDLDSHMIDVAKHNYPTLNFNVENLLDSLKDSHFDLITCFGNTIVHLNMDELNHLFYLVSKALNEKGFFIFQMLNYDSILKTKPIRLKELNHDSIKLTRTYDYHEKHIRFETILETTEGAFKGSTEIYPYQVEMLKELLNKANLDVSIYGDLVKDEIDDLKQHLYFVVTHKKNESS